MATAAGESVVSTGDERALITTGTLDRFGDLVRRAAVPVAVFAATGRATDVGIVFAVSFLPHIMMLGISSRLGAPLRARSSLITFNLLRFAASLALMALAIAGNFGPIFLLAIFVLAALTAVVEAAFGTATRLVAEDDDSSDVQQINARLSTWQNGAAATVGLPLGSWLGAVFAPAAFAIDAVTYLLAAGTVAASTIARRAAEGSTAAAHGIDQAVRWLSANPFNTAIVLAGMALNLASGLTLGNLVVIAVRQFGLPGSVVGFLMLLFSGTITIGSMFIARRSPGPILLLRIAALPSTVGYLVLAFTSTVPAMVIGLIMTASSIAAWNIASAGRMQTDPPGDVVGGVLALWRSTGVAAIAAGSAAGGFLIEATSTGHAMLLSASICIFAAVVMWLASSQERSAASGLAAAS